MLISTTAMLYKLINCYVLRHSSGSRNNNLAIETFNTDCRFQRNYHSRVSLECSKIFAMVVIFVVINVCNDW